METMTLTPEQLNEIEALLPRAYDSAAIVLGLIETHVPALIEAVRERDKQLSELFKRLSQDNIDLAEYELDAQKYCARIAELEAAQKWRPIETAPKDETEIILFVPRSTPTTGKWIVPNPRTETPFWYWSTYDTHGAVGPIYPTHWVPLPQPPALKGGE